MRLSYRTRQFYRRLFRFIGILLLTVLLLLLCWVLWLRRFILYTADGVVLDFSLSQQFPQGQVSQESQTVPVPDIYFSQTQTTVPPVTEVETHFEGYYVTVEELQEDTEKVLSQILNLPEDTPVMLDVKGYWGNFYYTSALGASSGSFDMAVMDAFFAAVQESGVYTIARLPAFRDYQFALNNTACGLKVAQGYLWVDDDRCYWLDPGNDQVLSRLVSIATELRDLGFDEVAFYNFAFPETDAVTYTGDKAQVLTDAAAALANACAREDFTISFITTDTSFALPEGNCRLYLENVAAVDVQDVLELLDEQTLERTVFFVQSYDTRFEACGVIRPLYMAT